MEDKTLTIKQMYDYQTRLQARFKGIWEPIDREHAVHKLMWAHGELAEAGDILKKQGVDAAAEDEKLRHDMMEEIGDVMMYLFDALHCLEMTPEEFSEIYKEKIEYNINKRWKDVAE